jgi:hypothetical protein
MMGFLLSAGLFTKHFLKITKQIMSYLYVHFISIHLSVNNNIVQQSLFLKEALLVKRIEDRYSGYDDGQVPLGCGVAHWLVRLSAAS